METIRYTVGMIAGLFDLACLVRPRNWVLSWVAYTAATSNGFDLTADLHYLIRRR